MIRQFVPSEVCLKCDGCCRFQDERSMWRPKWDKRKFIDDQDYVTTIADCGQHLCRFFNKGDHTCRTYHDRPFECELYPFLVSRHNGMLKVYVHLACPYIQEKETDPALDLYISYLKEFFNRPQTLAFLNSNSRMVQDYTPALPELRFLFDVPAGENDAAALLSHKPLFDEYAARGPRPLSCHHFASIFAWKDFFKFSFEIINDRLCVFAHQGKDSFLYLPPLGGEVDIPTLETCFKYMGSSRLARVENIPDNHLPGLEGHGYNTYLKTHEYVYRRTDLAELAGHAYKSQRHDIHVFERNFPQAEFRPYGPADHSACLALQQRWAEDRRKACTDEVYTAMLQDSAQVHALLMEYAAALGLSGRVIDIDGTIAGYTFGYALDAETFCVLLEVTDLAKTGSAAWIFNRFCRDEALKSFVFINTMDDFGMPHAAQTKNLWHPLKRLPVHNLTRKA